MTRTRPEFGFSLTELAVVLLIVSLLIGGLLIPLTSQDEIDRIRESRRRLAEIQEALIGFAILNERLPCPATAASNGFESFCDNPDPSAACNPTVTFQNLGRCSNPWDGFVPGATLGFAPIDPNGFVLDGWNTMLSYAVASVTDPATAGAGTRYVFTAAQGMKSRQISNLGTAPDLRVCTTATGITGAGTPTANCASAATTLTSNAVVVLYSLGRDGTRAGSGLGADDSQNPNPNTLVAADRAFVSHEPAPPTAPNGEFDDIVIWLSPNVLASRLVAAGRLP